MVSAAFRLANGRLGLVAADVAGLDERGFDVEAVHFVEHAFYQAFDGILGRAVRSQARDAESARGAAEDEVSALLTGAEVGQRKLDDVEGAEEVDVELVAQFALILVFAGSDDAYGERVRSCWTQDVDHPVDRRRV